MSVQEKVDRLLGSLRYSGYLSFDEFILLEKLRDDYLALRAIVEALAETSPIRVVTHEGQYLYECHHCEAHATGRVSSLVHTNDCAWIKARALVGPAGGEREAAG